MANERVLRGVRDTGPRRPAVLRLLRASAETESLVVSDRDDLELIRENVGHIARGCRSMRSHDPTAQEIAIKAGLDRLAARLERLEEALASMSDVAHEVEDGPDGQPVIIVLRPGTALDKAVSIARAALEPAS